MRERGLKHFTRGFLCLAFIVTLLAAAGKAMMLISGQSSPFEQSHALLPWLTVRQVALVALAAEAATLVAIAAGERCGLIAVASLYSAIGIYRCLLSNAEIAYACHCFGDLHKIFGVAKEKEEFVSLCLLVVLLTGGYALLGIRSLRRAKAPGHEPATESGITSL